MVQSQFEDNVSFENGRYVVSLPWRDTKVHLRSPEPTFCCYNFALPGPIGKIQAPICFSAAIGVQKALLQFLYLVAVLEMAYF